MKFTGRFVTSAIFGYAASFKVCYDTGMPCDCETDTTNFWNDSNNHLRETFETMCDEMRQD